MMQKGEIMYAIKGDSWRAVNSADDLQEGETLSDKVPFVPVDEIDIGAEKKEERREMKKLRGALKGKDIATLNDKQKGDLLLMLCIELGIADKNGVIK